jgi:hypothetical protein
LNISDDFAQAVLDAHHPRVRAGTQWAVQQTRSTLRRDDPFRARCEFEVKMQWVGGNSAMIGDKWCAGDVFCRRKSSEGSIACSIAAQSVRFGGSGGRDRRVLRASASSASNACSVERCFNGEDLRRHIFISNRSSDHQHISHSNFDHQRTE